MAVPKRKSSKARGRRRRAHDAVKRLKLQFCPQCNTAKPSHVVCPNCGHYQGRTIVETEE
jgi:large subunit ribosomal protein L32